jgi:protein transport protein SEC20
MTQMMNLEVERSANSVRHLDESSKLLSSTHQEYEQLQSWLTISKSLLSKLKQRDVIDRILFTFAFLVYFLVVIYVVKKRIWFPDFYSLFAWLYQTILGE